MMLRRQVGAGSGFGTWLGDNRPRHLVLVLVLAGAIVFTCP